MRKGEEGEGGGEGREDNGGEKGGILKSGDENTKCETLKDFTPISQVSSFYLCGFSVLFNSAPSCNYHRAMSYIACTAAAAVYVCLLKHHRNAFKLSRPLAVAAADNCSSSSSSTSACLSVLCIN